MVRAHIKEAQSDFFNFFQTVGDLVPQKKKKKKKNSYSAHCPWQVSQQKMFRLEDISENVPVFVT